MECKVCGLLDKDYYFSSPRTCKDCVKKRVVLREENLRLDTDWSEKERNRHREKYHRLGYKDIHKPTKARKKEIIETHNNKYPEKRKAKNLTQHIKPTIKGNQLHHWNYNIEFSRDVIELDVEGHGKLHRFLEYDTILFIYKTREGLPLNTRKKHEDFIRSLNIKIYN